MNRKVKILTNGGPNPTFFKLPGCGEVAELIPYICKNDDFNRKIQREVLGKELPDQVSEPYLEFTPGRSLAWPTAAKLGTIVDAETGEPISLKEVCHGQD